MTPPSKRLALDVTEEEAAFGFGLRREEAGVRAVVRELPAGLRAIKERTDEGTTEYAICDENLRSIYLPAKSLEELRRRFGQRGV